jgi:protein-S-isoprenylcysteine O-methyltransferase Ste14
MLRILVILLLALLSGSLEAYVGPGAGISVLGSLLGILATLFVAIGAILFWPVRKLMKRRKAASKAENTTESSPPESSSQP